ncbi:hypothetical protein M1116_03375 [Patescibacteria group bacterium]|nr:hypothetical protein [Patescibacteria group bacterium]
MAKGRGKRSLSSLTMVGLSASIKTKQTKTVRIRERNCHKRAKPIKKQVVKMIVFQEISTRTGLMAYCIKLGSFP